MKKSYIIIAILLVGITLFGQNVEIQGDATITGKVEVMDTIIFADGTALASACLQILQDADADTKIEVEQSPDEDIIRFTSEGAEIAVFNKNNMRLIHNGNSIFIGNSGGSDDGNNGNIAIGNYAAGNIVSGMDNIHIGTEAGSEEDASQNIFIGSQSGFGTFGNTNTFIGHKTGEYFSGNQNTAIGSGAGGQATGDGNVFVGFEAGKSMTGGNEMVIDNSDSTDPFLYGDLSSKKLVLNGTQNIWEANFTIHDLDGYYGGMNVNATSDGFPFYGFSTGGVVRGYQFMDSTGNWGFWKDGLAMFIDDNNYVGIGTSAPTNPLSVSASSDAGHVVFIENTSNDINADGLAIKINRPATGAQNNFVTFQDADGIAGRIEGFNTVDGDNLLSFPDIDFSTYFDVININSQAFDSGALPTMSGGQLPNLSLTLPDFDYQWPTLSHTAPTLSGGKASFNVSTMVNCIISGGSNCSNPLTWTPIAWNDGNLSWNAGYGIFSGGSYNWDRGTLPTFSAGRLPSFDIDAFINPIPIGSAAADFKEVMCWALENGERSLITTNPWDLKMLEAAYALKNLADCKSGGVTYGSKGADYAEYLMREIYTEQIEEGQIVGVKGGKITKKTEDAEQLLVISMMPIVLGNMPNDTKTIDQYEKVAFLGQAPVWVVGKVRSGDYIIPSGRDDGYGLAISPSDLSIQHVSLVVGRAWSDGDNAVNLVNMVIGIKTNELASILTKTEKRVEGLEARMDRFEKGFASIELAKK